MSKRNKNSFRPCVTQLENREVPSVASISSSASGILTVRANNATSDILVYQAPSWIYIEDQTTGHIYTYNPRGINTIVVDAGAGTSVFTATTTHPTTSALVEFIGGTGTDVFVGNSGPVSMQAGSGTDTLQSVTGNDTLKGGSGTDYIKGGSGNNLLEAGTGSDYLNGGTGLATIVGGLGNDTIVAMNGHADDTVEVGLGNEVIWEDDINGATDFFPFGTNSNDTVQAVTGFANTPANNSNVLNGGTFAEPTPLPNNFYQAFTNRPLFAPKGPTVQDVKQYINPAGGGVNGTGTNLDDSWLLSALGAIANTDPQVIEENVVYFGDGTYGVNLGGTYYRVDNKLPVNEYGDTAAAYASTGVANSLWVPIVEKAFAYYATTAGPASYFNLEAVNGGRAVNVYEAFGASTAFAGSIPFPGGLPNSTQLGGTIASLFQSGDSISVGLTATVTGTSLSTGAQVTLPANREYTVLSYSESFSGLITSVVLRDPDGTNPLGVSVTIANLTRYRSKRIDRGARSIRFLVEPICPSRSHLQPHFTVNPRSRIRPFRHRGMRIRLLNSPNTSFSIDSNKL
jgi:hypothetical protein